MRKDIRGYVSIFLALITLPVFSLAILTIDTVKIVSAKNHLSISNEIMSHSLLSRYNKTLYEKYKLFGISENQDFMSEYASYIIKENIENSNSRFYKAKFNSIDLDIESEDLLINPNNLEKQILDYMKLRAPYELSKGVINLFSITKYSKKHVEVLEKKLEYEEEYSKINQDFSKIGERLVYYDENFELINTSFFDLNKRLDLLKRGIEDIPEDENRDLDIIALLEKYALENEKLSSDLAIMQLNFEEIIHSLEKFSEDTSKLQVYLNEWGRAISEMDKSEIKNNFQSEFKSSKLEFTKENIDSLLSKLVEHKDTINNMKNTLEQDSILFYPKLSMIEDLNSLNFNFTNNKKLPSLNNYKVYKYINDSMYRDKIDKSKIEEAKNKKREVEILADKKSEIEIDNQNSNLFDYISKEDFENISAIIENSNYDVSNASSITNYKNILNKSTSLISDSSSTKENIYIALFIVDHFSNKINKNSNFDSQIEYILFGNDKLSRNTSNVENSIFAIRFLLNSLYAYTNADLGRESALLATAIAGWTGFGVPIVKSALLASMSFGETIIDLNTLNKGESLAGFKNKSSWQVSLSSVPSLITKNMADITNSAIDNIFDFVGDFTEEGVDGLNSKIDQFTIQTIDGISQSIISEILNPIQTSIISNIGKGPDILQENINESISIIRSNIDDENTFINSLKREVLEYVRSRINEKIDSLNETNIESYFIEISNDLEQMILNKTSEINNDLKIKINDAISKNKIQMKTKVNEYVEEYITKFGVEGNSISKGAISGLNFDYKDYLTLLISMKLSTNKDEILKRMALIINSEIKKVDSSFDITKCITDFSYQTKIDINTMILKKYIFLDEIIEKKRGGY